MGCAFCDIDPSRIVAENDVSFAIRDGYPVSPGHTLVIPRRHFAGWFDANAREHEGMLDLLEVVKAAIDREFSPDGYNIGVNDGPAAGQTVMHLHIHVIPRYQGDVDDPTGGVRLAIPDKGNYKNPGHIPRSSGGSVE